MDGMEDTHENEHKRKAVDIRGASPSSSSNPVNVKKRRLSEGSCVSADSNPPIPSSHETVEKIKKYVQFIRYHVESSCELDDNVEAVRALKGILNTDEEHAETMVGEGTVSVLIQQLQITSHISSNDRDGVPAGVEILEECALTLLKSLAGKSDSARKAIIEEGAIPHFLRLLTRKHRHADDELPLRIHRVVLEILEVLSPTDVLNVLLADEDHDGIEFALELLSPDRGVQLSALRLISAFTSENEEYRLRLINSRRIICPQLTAMLSSKHVDVRWGAAFAVLAMSQSVWLRGVLFDNGIWDRVVGMLYSSDSKCRSLGAQMVTRFANVQDPFASVQDSPGLFFLNDGALTPLIQMLSWPNLRRDAILAILACSQGFEVDGIRIGIIIERWLHILMDIFLLREIQTDPAVAPRLRHLLLMTVDHRDGPACFVKMGGLRLVRKNQIASDRCRCRQDIGDILSAIRRRIGRSIDYPTRSLILTMRECDDFVVRARCAHAVALFVHPYHLQEIFGFNNYLEILLELYGSAEPDDQYEAAEALHNIAHWFVRTRERVFPIDEAFFVANPRLSTDPIATTPASNISIVNNNHNPNPNPNRENDIELNNNNYDITFLLDDKTKQLQAHKSVLRQASDVFRAMLSENFNDATHGVIEVPNISYSAFKSVIDFIYTGRQPQEIDEAYDIFEAADFYNLQSLKQNCIYMIARRDLVVERVAQVYEFADKFDAGLLMHACILFILEYHEQVRSLPWFRPLVDTIIPEIRRWFPSIIPVQHNGHSYEV